MVDVLHNGFAHFRLNLGEVLDPDKTILGTDALMLFNAGRSLDELELIAAAHIAVSLQKPLKIHTAVGRNDNPMARGFYAVDGYFRHGSNRIEVFEEDAVLGTEGEIYCAVRVFPEDLSVYFDTRNVITAFLIHQ